MARTPMLSSLQQPTDIAQMSFADLAVLAQELRTQIITTVAHNGGHLAPSLGVVELTLALLRQFNPSEDRILWDVGHQSYAWKLLTGRADRFATLRTENGLRGFPSPFESPYDHFGVGHASTSISAALGMALARDLAGKKHNVVAVIGDGALSGGLALEGLNQAGDMQRKLIVVLNDNEMSISHNVGALSLMLSRNLSRRWVRRVKHDIIAWLQNIPGIGDDMVTLAKRSQDSLKSFFTPGILFEAFRFTYIGPVDGHDTRELVRHLEMASQIDKPVLLHVLTHKGKGYPPAEENPTLYHGVGAFEPLIGCTRSKPCIPTFTQIFSETLCELAAYDPRVMAITAAMPEGTGTEIFAKQYPDRFIDVGICEEHAVTFAAGLAKEGLRPFVAIYSTFLQRAYDQIIHDVCLQKLPVTFCIDRAGLVGEDGATHQGAFDISYLRHIPNIRILAPRDEKVLRDALYTALHQDAPIALRYPRGSGFAVDCTTVMQEIPLALGELLLTGTDALIIACGNCVHPALTAARLHAEQNGQAVSVFDPRWIKPLPEEQILSLVAQHKRILFVEENALAGGFSSSVLELLADHQALGMHHIMRLGLPDVFVEHASAESQRARFHLDALGIQKHLAELCAL